MANLKITEDVVDKNGNIQSYPVGTIIISMSSTIPDGWLLCDGSLINIQSYPELYSLIGTTYGSGSGTFSVPPLVYNSTYNLNPRFPFSTLSLEPAYPNSFIHSHGVSINATSFSQVNHVHNHNSNSGTSPADNYSHNHGGMSGNTDTSGASTNPNAANLSSAGRLAGPSGPYFSGPSGGVNHTHGGAAWSQPSTNNDSVSHTHSVTIHNQTNHNHNHATNLSSSTHTVSDSTFYPLSKQVYFLIKT